MLDLTLNLPKEVENQLNYLETIGKTTQNFFYSRSLN